MVLSWGRVHRFDQQELVLRSGAVAGPLRQAFDGKAPVIAHGLGRSYGDVALNEGGTVLLTPHLDEFILADWTTGVVRASAGLANEELLRVAVPKGWFLPVTPGTKFVTLGGAVANDVHGKNHHHAGSFGTYVRRIGLFRSDRGEIECSREENSDLFALTIGGLGLTGVILWVEFQLAPITSAFLDVENLPCQSLDDFFRLSHESRDWPYTVMWVDCLAKGDGLGRGIFSRGRPLADGRLNAHSRKQIVWPVTMPGWVLNRLSISAFNLAYLHRPGALQSGAQHYDPFFYPLDRILGWNKLYGARGFFQHQSIIPMRSGAQGVRTLLKRIEKSGQGSFLAVLKVHGPETSPGVMSFCMEGVSLALDFANNGAPTRALLGDLDAIVSEHGGRLYPAKDGHMSSGFFQSSYPMWTQLEASRDPKISSSFWRRVTQAGKHEA